MTNADLWADRIVSEGMKIPHVVAVHRHGTKNNAFLLETDRLHDGKPLYVGFVVPDEGEFNLPEYLETARDSMDDQDECFGLVLEDG